MYKFKNLFQSNAYGLWGVCAACLFSVAFSAISIYSASKQNSGQQILVQHPLKVSAAIYAVREAVAEMHIRMDRLATYNAPADVALVRTAFSSLLQSIEKEILYITVHYQGPIEHAEHFERALRHVYAIQVDILSEASLLSKEALNQRMEKDLRPLYEDIDATLANKMLASIEESGRQLYTDSISTLHLNTLLSLCIAAVMILLGYLFQRAMCKRARERAYHNYLLQIISENAGTAFMLYALRSQKLDYISPNIRSVAGFDPAVLKENPQNLLHCGVSEQQNVFSKIFDSKILCAPLSGESLFRNPETGEERWLLCHIFPLRGRANLCSIPAEGGLCALNPGRSIAHYVLSITDMTKIKKNQQALRDALLAAENANTAKSQFFSRMSHDIRTPMNAIIGMTTIAATAMDDKARVQDCLAKIASSSRHLLMLINAVLDMSKIESGKFAIAHKVFDFREVLKNITAIILPQAQAKKQSFVLDSSAVTHKILVGDPLRLNQILLNILGNAVKFTPEGGSIHVLVQEKADKQQQRVWMNFVITDTGVGMSSAFLKRLFLPFEQEHQTSSHTVGTGLGMAITKNVISLMHGTLEVESKTGQGTTFKVGLDFGVNPARLQPAEETAPTPNFQGKHFLLAEDNEINTEIAVEFLKITGATVDVAKNGALAVQAFTESAPGTYAAVLMDIQMPVMNGYQATKALRQSPHPEAATVPIIAMTANAFVDDVTAALQSGMNDHIGKPIDITLLFKKLSFWLQEKA